MILRACALVVLAYLAFVTFHFNLNRFLLIVRTKISLQRSVCLVNFQLLLPLNIQQ